MPLRLEAPNRIDLAGGSLDLGTIPFILNENLDGVPVTINAAIDIMTSVEIDEADGIFFEDRSATKSWRWASLEDMKHVPSIDLVQRLVRFFMQGMEPDSPLSGGIKIAWENNAPRGAGLGTSSALSSCLWMGLSHMRGWDTGDIHQVASACSRLEAASVNAPPGLQDYYGALLGGLNILNWDFNGTFIETVERAGLLDSLSARTLLFYTKPHRSGSNNWRLYRGFFEDNEVREQVRELHGNSMAMAEMFRRLDDQEEGPPFDPGSLAPYLRKEWDVRRRMSSEKEELELFQKVDALIDSGIGATAAKFCGAGGGGSIMILLESETHRDRVASAMVEGGMRELPFSFIENGFQIVV